jgi:8-oxo-dGTP pyrophosphatase MutT (NUDIX family)
VNDGRLLMIKQRRPYGTHGELPSGYYEPGESFEQAAAREVREETGIDVEVGELVCTLVWEREHDRRRNVVAFFRATPVDPGQVPRPQLDEDIEDAAYLDLSDIPDGDIHPLELAILDRWPETGSTGFHVRAVVSVHADGTQSYAFRSHAS